MRCKKIVYIAFLLLPLANFPFSKYGLGDDRSVSVIYLQFFSNSISDNEALKNSDYKEGYCYYRVSDGTHKFEYSLSHNGLFDFGECQD